MNLVPWEQYLVGTGIWYEGPGVTGAMFSKQESAFPEFCQIHYQLHTLIHHAPFRTLSLQI